MLKEIDKRIINLLITKPGITQKQLAEEIGVTPPAIHNRMQRMKDKGIINGFLPLLDMKKLGYDITVVVKARVRNGKLREAAERVVKDTYVCALYRISGEDDIIIIAKFRNTDELNEWNQRILAEKDVIERTNTSLVFNSLKEGIFPNKIL